MSRFIDVKLASNRSVRIDATYLSDRERQVAIGALRDAELIVDAFSWIAKKIEQLGARLFLKPSLKH